jgi:ankyrin repeat protein
MPTRPLPSNSSFEHLKKEAKRLHKAVRDRNADALARVKAFHPRATGAGAHWRLADAQLVTARSYGFASWTNLKESLAASEPFVWRTPPSPDPGASLADVFVRLACLVYGDWQRTNVAKARRLLADHPEIANANVYAAAATGDVATVRAMLDRDPALVNANGGPLHWAPLLYACYSRMDDGAVGRSTVDVARLLLSRGADPNAGFLWNGSYALTALTGAFGRGEDNMNELAHPHALELATLLLDAGADPNDSQTLYNRHFEEDDDHLILLFEYGLGRESTGPWLKRTGDRSWLGSPSTLLIQELCWAAMHNFPKRVTLLVEHGVDVNARSPRDGRTAYEAARREGHDDIAEFLAAHGARRIEPSAADTFSLACIHGRRAQVQAMLAADPALLDRMSAEDRLGLLHRAIGANERDGVRLIVELGVDVNSMIPNTGLDRAPLHSAAGGGDLEMVKLLIGLGADPQLRDYPFQAAPIGWAKYGQHQDVVDYLFQYASIFDAVHLGGVERAASLLEQTPSLAQVRDGDGDPLAFYLCPDIDRLDEMIAQLTTHGVDLNATGRTGATLLDRALAHGWAEFSDVLRRHGARTTG